MAKCVFCGKEQDDYKGIYLLKNDGTSIYFCTSKCRKNSLKLKRDKRKMKWTEAFHLARGKRVTKEKEKVESSRVEKAEKKKSAEKK